MNLACTIHPALSRISGNLPLLPSACLWHLGYPDRALHRINEALALARNLSHSFSLAYALSIASLVHQLRRDEAAAQELAESAIKLSTEHEFVHWTTWAGRFAVGP